MLNEIFISVLLFVFFFLPSGKDQALHDHAFYHVIVNPSFTILLMLAEIFISIFSVIFL